MRIDSVGKYMTRDGRVAEVRRLGQAMAVGLVDGRSEEWARHNAKNGLGFDVDSPLDIVGDDTGK